MGQELGQFHGVPGAAATACLLEGVRTPFVSEEDELATQAGVDRRLPLVVAITGIDDRLATSIANHDRSHALRRHLDLQWHAAPPGRTFVRIRRLYQNLCL